VSAPFAAYARPVRRRLREHWWVWLAIAVVAVVANELIDRGVVGDKNGHPLGDVLVAVVLVVIAISLVGLAGRRQSRRKLR
jgi:hypothetical protein